MKIGQNLIIKDSGQKNIIRKDNNNKSLINIRENNNNMNYINVDLNDKLKDSNNNKKIINLKINNDDKVTKIYDNGIYIGEFKKGLKDGPGKYLYNLKKERGHII